MKMFTKHHFSILMISRRKNCNFSSSSRLLSNLADTKANNAEDEKEIDIEWNNAIPYDKMPGPKGLSFLHFLPGGKYSNLPREKFTKLIRDEYGEIFKFSAAMGKPDIVISHNPFDYEKVFRVEGIWPFRLPLDTVVHYRTVKNPEAFMGVGGLLSVQDEEWGKFRSIVNPVLMQPRTVRNYIPRMDKVADEFINKIREIRDPNTNEVPGTFEEIINLWTLESVAVVALDKQLGLLKHSEKNPDAMQLIEDLSKFFSLTIDLDGKVSIWKYIRTPKYYQLMKALDSITNITRKYIDEALERYKTSTPESESVNENDKSVLERLSKYDKKVAIVMAMDMLMAGVDTTSSAFIGCLLALAKNPKKQAKLHEEIRNVLPNKYSSLTAENMKRLPYLRACIKEGIRMYPIVEGTVRRTIKNTVLSGYQVPKGTNVFMPFIHLDGTKHGFDKPTEFIPERWLREEQTEDIGCPLARKSTSPFAYLPFGFGPRSCIGKRIVEMELEIALSKIVRNFNVEFNYPDDDIFKLELIFVPDKELKFKFTEIDN